MSPLTLNFPLMGRWTANPERFGEEDVRKYRDSDIRGMLGGNFRRVLSEIRTVPPVPRCQ